MSKLLHVVQGYLRLSDWLMRWHLFPLIMLMRGMSNGQLKHQNGITSHACISLLPKTKSQESQVSQSILALVDMHTSTQVCLPSRCYACMVTRICISLMGDQFCNPIRKVATLSLINLILLNTSITCIEVTKIRKHDKMNLAMWQLLCSSQVI